MAVDENSIQFDISAQTSDFLELIQDKPPFKPPATADDGDWLSDSSDEFQTDMLPSLKIKITKELSNTGVQVYPHKEAVVVVTDDKNLAKTSSYYGLLTCSRYQQKKDVRSKLNAMGVKNQIETGSFIAHTSEYLYMLYSFPDQKSLNDMCRNVFEHVTRVVHAKTKKSDRIPISLHPVRLVYSKLKSCLEFYVPLNSFKEVVEALMPIFATMDQFVFYLSGSCQSGKEEDFAPITVSDPSLLPSFVPCLRFERDTLKTETERLFNRNNWSILPSLSDTGSLSCFVNTEYGKSIPYIFCETGVDMGFAIYVLVPGDTDAMVRMREFYDVLFSESGVALKDRRVVYPLYSETRSDMQLVLMEVPSDRIIFRQDSLTLFILTTHILPLICKLKCPITAAQGINCISVEDPLGNRVVLRDISSAHVFKESNPSGELKFTV